MKRRSYKTGTVALETWDVVTEEMVGQETVGIIMAIYIANGVNIRHPNDMTTILNDAPCKRKNAHTCKGSHG